MYLSLSLPLCLSVSLCPFTCLHCCCLILNLQQHDFSNKFRIRKEDFFIFTSSSSISYNISSFFWKRECDFIFKFEKTRKKLIQLILWNPGMMWCVCVKKCFIYFHSPSSSFRYWLFRKKIIVLPCWIPVFCRYCIVGYHIWNSFIEREKKYSIVHHPINIVIFIYT